MKLMSIALVALSLSTVAFADFRPGRERPGMRAIDMEITDAQMAFEHVQRVDMDMNWTDGVAKPTSLSLTMAYADQETGVLRERKVRVAITDVRKIECGSTQYSASLPGDISGRNQMGARFNVSLVDHSTRICRDFKPFQWEADVREGFGWCGTGDATMSLQGNPEHLAVTL